MTMYKTVEELAKQMVKDEMEAEKRCNKINEAKGLKPYSINPLDDMNWDED